MKFKEILEKYFAESLTDEVTTEISTLFNAMVAEAAEKKAEEIKAEMVESEKEALKTYVEALSNTIDSFITKRVDEFVAENKVALESSVKVEMADKLIESLVGVMKESKIEISEEKVDIVSKIEEEKSELSKKIDEVLEENMKMREDVLTLKKGTVFLKMTEGLSKNERSKLAKLIEGVEARDIDNFKAKLHILIEHFVKETDVKEDKVNTEDPAATIEEDKKDIIEAPKTKRFYF